MSVGLSVGGRMVGLLVKKYLLVKMTFMDNHWKMKVTQEHVWTLNILPRSVQKPYWGLSIYPQFSQPTKKKNKFSNFATSRKNKTVSLLPKLVVILC